MHKVSVGVLGASGYTGRELCSLILGHPALELVFASASSQAGTKARIAGRDIQFCKTENAALGTAELVFSALPHGTSAEWARRARSAGAKVVDLSADLRPGNGAAGDIPYGLTELMRESVTAAPLVANPGCYPTAVLLGLAPVIKRGLVAADRGAISISAASGVTGAGFTPRLDLLFAEIAEDFRAYAWGNTHRHLAEMREVIEKLGGNNDLVFVPHLLPVSRGILATMIVPLRERIEKPIELWEIDYAGEPFIEVSVEAPSLKDVVRRNVVRISATNAAGVRQPTLVVIAAVDNLMKGAAGQAVQNANLMLGIDETAGLPA